MTISPEFQPQKPSRLVIEWLLDSDPAIRWQVMRDLTDAPLDEVAAERARVAREGWGAWLLSMQGDDGRWGGAAWNHGWNSSMHVLMLLREMGLDPASHQARRDAPPVVGAWAAVLRVRLPCRVGLVFLSIRSNQICAPSGIGFFCQLEGGLTTCIQQVHIGTRNQEYVHQISEISSGCNHQRGVPETIPGIHIRASFDEHIHHRIAEIICIKNPMQRTTTV
jgi:hypothetical protein